MTQSRRKTAPFAATDAGITIRHQDPAARGRWVDLTLPP